MKINTCKYAKVAIFIKCGRSLQSTIKFEYASNDGNGLWGWVETLSHFISKEEIANYQV